MLCVDNVCASGRSCQYETSNIQGKMYLRIFIGGLVAIFVQTLFSFLIVGYVIAQCEDPDILVISIIPTEESIQEFNSYKPLINYLSEKTGKKIEVYVPVSYSNMIDAMVKNWVNVAILGPYAYTIANTLAPEIRVFATVAKRSGYIQEAGPGYKSVLITRKGSRFTSIASLQNGSVDMIDPVSTSGNLVPRTKFSQIIDRPIEAFFGKIIYSGGHDLAALAVYEGEVDAAFVATHRFENIIERGMVQKEYFNYLWFSDVIPQDPICYWDTLCSDLKSKIEKTFLTFHTQPTSSKFFSKINADKFVKITSKSYDIIRELKKNVDVQKAKR